MGLVAVAIAAVVLVAALAGSGSSARGRASGPFAGLHPASPPPGWNVARTPGGLSVAYPPGWRRIKTDPGTATVALLGRDGEIESYLNVTPRQGDETLANWSRFRPQHNRGEGARRLRVLAATDNAPFRSGRGSCVTDDYTTSKATYREIACLVPGAGTTAVVVGAAPIALWDQQAPTLERAISTFVP